MSPRRLDRIAESPVIVLGNGITALGVIRILARNGLEAWVADPTDPLLRRSRWFRRCPGNPPPLGAAEDLQAWLERLDVPGGVLMPCSDHWVGEVSTLSAELRERFPASVGEAESVDRLLDKGRFAETLVEMGLPHPWSGIVESETDLDGIPDEIFASAILKPRNSQRFVQRFGVKALHVRSRMDAATQLRRLGAEGIQVILQEYIPGSATEHYFVDGFVDRGGSIRATFVRQRLRMYPEDFGNSTAMVSIPPDVALPAVVTISSLLTHIGFRGIYSAEFKRDTRDGVFKILEVNARPWWFVDFAARCGVDVCRMAYDDARQQPVAGVDEYQVGRALVFPYMDYFACVNKRARGELSLWGWLRSWTTSRQPVFEFSDPWPAVRASTKVVGGFMRKWLLRS